MAEISDGGDEDNTLVLKCIDPGRRTVRGTDEEDIIILSTTDINTWDLPSMLGHQIVEVKVNRNRLIEQSSYFHGLLSGSFSESSLDSISIVWNVETLLSVLRFVLGCPVDVDSDNFLTLYEAALFFGVELLLLKCRIWLTEVTSYKGHRFPQLQLDDLTNIWKFGLGHANEFIPELCSSYLARNFMWAISSESFNDIPFDFLLSCIKHPHLTVDSEKQLCDAVLVWLAANKSTESPRSNEGDCTDILKEIRISLLPLYFALGKRRWCYFSKIGDKSIDSILTLFRYSYRSFINGQGGNNLHSLKIRLTEYSKKMDLSGCPQVNPMLLLVSLLPNSYNMDSILGKAIEKSLFNLKTLDEGKCQIPWGKLPTLSFDAVYEVDISNCPMLHLEEAIECFHKSFPSLRIFKAAHFLNFKIEKLSRLMDRCPLLCEIDLTVDITPVIPGKVSIISSSPALKLQTSTVLFGDNNSPSGVTFSYMSGLLLSRISSLTLEGRSDVSDSDLKNISDFCVSLCYLNIKGCILVTDSGISIIIKKCIKLHSIVACDTSFGQNSILALCGSIPNFDHSATLQVGKTRGQPLAYKLQTLHIGGCKGIDEISLSELMSELCMVKSLFLYETQLVDNALYSFAGSSLEILDVSDTKVSGDALAHIICQNPGLNSLKARGCRNLSEQENKAGVGGFQIVSYGCGKIYWELGKCCKLEEIALGWGFSYISMESLNPAITKLKALTVGLGGSLGLDGLCLLYTSCPLLESLILYFQVISDAVVHSVMECLRHLKVLALCYCFGELSSSSFAVKMPNLRKLRLQRVAPWMTNDDLVILTQNCSNLNELSLLGCMLLNSDSQTIISSGWPGLISIHLEECGEVTKNGVTSLFDCQALEDITLHHNGSGLQRNFIIDASSKMPMLRKVSLDFCDARDGDFDIPNYGDRYFLSTVKIARCKLQKSSLDLPNLKFGGTPVHKESLILAWDSKNLTRTVIKERA